MATLYEWDSGAVPPSLGTTPTLNNTDGAPAAPSIQFDQVASTDTRVVYNSPPTVVAIRCYLRTPTAWASAATAIITVDYTGGIVAGFSLAGTGNPGQTRLRAKAAYAVTSTGAAVTTDTWYRIELQYDLASTRARAAVFPLASDVALWDSLWRTRTEYVETPTGISFGRPEAGPTLGTFRVDSIKITDDVSGWIGRHPDDAAPGGTATYWDGTQEVPLTLEGVWNGTAVDPISSIEVSA